VHKINVVNKTVHASTYKDFYVGRGSVLGNPFTSKDLSTSKAKFKCNTKAEAIKSYAKYIDEAITDGENPICDELNKIYKAALKEDINLVCYCAPKPCHGDIIKSKITTKLIRYYIKNKGNE